MGRDLLHQTFGQWTVIATAPSHNARAYWLCRCFCGVERPVTTGNLLSGASQSCGCAKRGRPAPWNEKHGQTDSPTWRSWLQMRRRCREHPRYVDITYDPRWEDFDVFLADMGERPAGHTLDRIDNNGDYQPDNCRWATYAVQANNRRNSLYVTFDGETKSVSQWARDVGLPSGALHNRIKRGWSVDDALHIPLNARRS